MWTDLVTVAIDVLPDDVLLHIFRFIQPEDVDRLWSLSWGWHRLVHVCRRWRSVVFSSPNFLDLRLVCCPWTRVELIPIWPPIIPIIIRNMFDWPMPEDYDFDAVMVHHNRVREIDLLHLTGSQLQRLASAMLVDFPALIHLTFGFGDDYGGPAPALPDEFLAGSAPCLQSLELHSIPFPVLPKLLLSATHLVRLSLRDVPHSGYVSPEAIVTGLAVMNNLRSFIIEFESPLSCPRQGSRPPPPTRTVLPALTRFEFRGISEYLEDLVARIDTPLLDSIWITFFQQLIFDIPRLAQFMGRTTRFETLNEAHVEFDYQGVQIGNLPPTRTFQFEEKSGLRISCREVNWQLSSLAQVLTSVFPSIHMVEHLYISGPRYLPSQWQQVEITPWLGIFLPFTDVRNLYVCKEFAQCIALSLQDLVGEIGMGMLPALESLFLENLQPSGPVQEDIQRFVVARRRLGYPVAVFEWDGT